MSLGKALLKARSLFSESYWYWIGVGALIGYTILFNILFTFFLSKLNRKSTLLPAYNSHDFAVRTNTYHSRVN